MATSSTSYQDNQGKYYLPNIQLTCLQSAESSSIYDVIEGTNTIIDFWTTSCTRCPAALDKLNKLAQLSKYSNARFLSINCGDCDGARNILEEHDELKWTSIHHYATSIEDKELAKEALGFAQVPFYVVLDSNGCILQRGSQKKIDFDNLFLEVDEEEERKEESLEINVNFSVVSQEDVILNKDMFQSDYRPAIPMNMEEKEDVPVVNDSSRMFILDEDF